MGVLQFIRQIIATVPRGKVVTYGQVAEAAGLHRSARLVVWALHGAGTLPWHRVVAAGGRIALQGDEGRLQRSKLRSEGVTFVRGKVRMEVHRWRELGRGADAGTRIPSSRRSQSRSKRAD